MSLIFQKVFSDPRTVLICLVMVAFLTAGCGKKGGGGEEGDDSGAVEDSGGDAGQEDAGPVFPVPEIAELSNSSFCEALAATACYDMFACCDPGSIEALIGSDIAATEEDCRRAAEAACRNIYGAYLYSLASGAVALQIEAVKACLQAQVAPKLAARTTTIHDQCILDENAVVQACGADWFVGTVAPGGACAFAPRVTGLDPSGPWSFVCADDGICRPDNLCHARADLDAGCSTAIPCKRGLHCEDGTGRCVNPIDVDGDCTAYEDNPFTGTPCKEGLYCAVPDGGTPVCKALIADGAACTLQNGSECASSYCAPALCTNGNPCWNDEDCAAQRQCYGSVADVECEQDSDCPGVCSVTGGICCSDAFGDCADEAWLECEAMDCECPNDVCSEDSPDEVAGDSCSSADDCKVCDAYTDQQCLDSGDCDGGTCGVSAGNYGSCVMGNTCGSFNACPALGACEIGTPACSTKTSIADACELGRDLVE